MLDGSRGESGSSSSGAILRQVSCLGVQTLRYGLGNALETGLIFVHLLHTRMRNGEVLPSAYLCFTTFSIYIKFVLSAVN
jgi:hypothetical protein